MEGCMGACLHGWMDGGMHGWRSKEIRAGQGRGMIPPYPTQDKESPSPHGMRTGHL